MPAPGQFSNCCANCRGFVNKNITASIIIDSLAAHKAKLPSTRKLKRSKLKVKEFICYFPAETLLA
jgi:hypothetical protein